MDLELVARAVGARAMPPAGHISGWSVDSRTLAPGDLFFALRGVRHDGHDHVAEAMARGAAGAVVERRSGAGVEIEVAGTLAALQLLAWRARRWWGGTVIAVTGSAGKTTTKDAIAHLVGAAMAVGKSIGNLNNHVGLPLAILRLPDECRAAVLEMGMNHAGELRELAAIARPDIAVVTNAGSAHVEFFDSMEGVAMAKRELVESLAREGIAVLNADDARVAAFAAVHGGRTITFGVCEGAEVRARDVRESAAATCFRVDGVEFELQLPGRHNLSNMLAALAVARALEIPWDALGGAVRSFAAASMRGERIERDGVVVWNDCYNSNPEAARAMIDVLAATPARRRIAVLGEMLELGAAGPALHRGLGRHLAGRGIDVAIGVRGAAADILEGAVEAGLERAAAVIFEAPEAAGEYARKLARPGDALLFKGSRGVRVERALDRFLA